MRGTFPRQEGPTQSRPCPTWHGYLTSRATTWCNFWWRTTMATCQSPTRSMSPSWTTSPKPPSTATLRHAWESPCSSTEGPAATVPKSSGTNGILTTTDRGTIRRVCTAGPRTPILPRACTWPDSGWLTQKATARPRYARSWSIHESFAAPEIFSCKPLMTPGCILSGTSPYKHSCQDAWAHIVFLDRCLLYQAVFLRQDGPLFARQFYISRRAFY